MLDELGVPYRYREYREEPLSVEELRSVLALLGKTPREMLRPKESAAQGISPDLEDADLIAAMAAEPTLLQRPILTDGTRALLARPADLLRDFLSLRFKQS